MKKIDIATLDRVDPRIDDIFETYTGETFHKIQNTALLWAAESYASCANEVLSGCSVISRTQAKSNTVNESVAILRDGEVRGARPAHYGRAALLVCRIAGEDRCFDVKGVGVADSASPRPDVHETGVLFLNKAIEEILRRRIVASSLKCQDLDVGCVDDIALILTGYRARDRDKSPAPTALLVREACHRAEGNLETDPFGSNRFRFCMWMELYLRQFGISSSADQSKYKIWRKANGELQARKAWSNIDWFEPKYDQEFLEKFADQYGVPFTADMPNIQTTRSNSYRGSFGKLVDFGQYGVYPSSFELPLVFPAANRPFCIGQVVERQASKWFEPDEALRFAPTEQRVSVPESVKQWMGLPDLTIMSEIKLLSVVAAMRLDNSELEPNHLEQFFDSYTRYVTERSEDSKLQVFEILQLGNTILQPS